MLMMHTDFRKHLPDIVMTQSESARRIGILRWDIFGADQRLRGWIFAPTAQTAARHIWRHDDLLDWHYLRNVRGFIYKNPTLFADRLKQFWQMGHNMAVLGIPEDEIQTILDDNRFNRYAMHRLEWAALMDGFDTRPLRWTRDQLAFITVRPMLWTESTTQKASSVHYRAQVYRVEAA